MTQDIATADGGDADDVDEHVELSEETVTTAAALVDLLDEGHEEEIARQRAARILEVLEETGATLLKLQSSWHGNEFIGDWGEYWFAHIDFETEKAVHMSEVVEAGYPMRMVGKIQRERESYSPNERSLERYAEGAFKNWENAEQTGPSWGSPDWLFVTDEYCPKSAIDTVISAPARDDHHLFTHEESRRGALDDADLVVRKTVMDEYESSTGYRREEKFAVEGETYEAFVSANLKNVLPFMNVEDDGEVVEQGTFHSYNGDYWVVGMDGLNTFIDYATEAGFIVGVHEDYADRLNEE